MDKAAKRSHVCMKQRIAELCGMRKHLEDEIAQSRVEIAHAEQELRKMRKHINDHHASPEHKFKDEKGPVDVNAFNSRAKLTLDVLKSVRAKIKGAAYTGHSARQLDVVFGRFDRDGSGQLDEDEVRSALRRSLKIPPSVISDAEVSGLCATLDMDNSGSISIAEIVEFLHSDIDVEALKATRAK